MMKTIVLKVNGEDYDVSVEPHETLATVLREKLRLTGSKIGCENGECGACTVLLDGKAVTSCLTPVLKAEGKQITTVEGLSDNGKLHPLQDSFIEHGAIQCGFCSPGMILSAKALLDENPRPTEQEVRVAVLGNLCRCTGYQQIVQAILAAAEQMASN